MVLAERLRSSDHHELLAQSALTFTTAVHSAIFAHAVRTGCPARAACPPWRPAGGILRYLAGSLGQGMAGKIVELRAVLLVSGAVRLVHPGTERKALIRAMPSRERGNPLKIAFLAQNRFHLSISWCLFFSIFLLYK